MRSDKWRKRCDNLPLFFLSGLLSFLSSFSPPLLSFFFHSFFCPRSAVTAYRSLPSSGLSAETRSIVEIQPPRARHPYPPLTFIPPLLPSSRAALWRRTHAIRSLLNIWWKLTCATRTYVNATRVNWKSMERLARRVYRMVFPASARDRSCQCVIATIFCNCGERAVCRKAGAALITCTLINEIYHVGRFPLGDTLSRR